MAPKVAFVMSDYGHDPTETAVPYAEFKKAGFEVVFVTETGKSPVCDKRMLEGLTQKLLGAEKSAIEAYTTMKASVECSTPLSWSTPRFSLTDYDIVMLPGGHDKGVQQVIDSVTVHGLLAAYLPLTKRPSGKVLAAICHGVMALAAAEDPETKKSLVYDLTTTALPGTMESVAFRGTQLFLGDYYKTYGACSENVETYVRKRLRAEGEQWKSSLGMKPFVVEDEQYNYVSGRFPPDAKLLAERAIALVGGKSEGKL